MEVGDKGYEVMKASKNDKCKKETGVEMIDFNIDMNPNRIDMKNYNPDQEAYGVYGAVSGNKTP